MRISTALNHRDRFLSRLTDIYAHARRQGLPHSWILDARQSQIFDLPEWGRVPRWVRSAVTHASGRRLDALYKPNLHGRDLARIADGSLKPDSVPYLRNATRIDGVEYTTDEICDMANAAGDNDARCAVWASSENATVWNHRPDQPFSGWRKWGDTGPRS